MKFKNVFLAMAFVCAIGLSFATESSNADPSMDYYLVDAENEIFAPLGEEVDCRTGATICLAQRFEGGPIHVVYDAPQLGTEKDGTGEVSRLWEN